MQSNTTNIENTLFDDPLKYRYAKLYGEYIIGLKSRSQVLEEENIQDNAILQVQSPEINNKYLKYGVIPLTVKGNGMIVLGYTDGVDISVINDNLVEFERISIIDYFDFYKSVSGNNHPDLRKLPIKIYTDAVIKEALSMKGIFDITMTVRGDYIIFYYNVFKRKKYSNIRIEKTFLKEVVQSITKLDYDPSNRKSIPINIKLNEEYDGRGELTPTNNGNCLLTIRPTPHLINAKDLQELGYSKQAIEFIMKMSKSRKPGLRIIMGSTCSGKNTSLLALIKKIVEKDEDKIVSIENPKESDIPGIEQIDCTDENAADMCHALIRHNPDVLYATEINDRNGQAIIDVANTDKVVFSSLHCSGNAMYPQRMNRVSGIDPYDLILLTEFTIQQKLVPIEGGVKPLIKWVEYTEDLKYKLIGMSKQDMIKEIHANECGDSFEEYQ